MSFAFSAAPFENNDINENKNSNNLIDTKRKNNHKKTQKNTNNINTHKVNSILEQLHNNTNNDSDDDNNDNNDINYFNPPEKPYSAGVQKTIINEEMSNMHNNKIMQTLGKAPIPINYENDGINLNNYEVVNNSGTNKINNYETKKNEYSNTSFYQNNLGNNNDDVILKKLNYVINLLEEQQDEKTDNVTEEVVLYSFLGIFMIFIVDSFAKVGKYVR